MMEHIRQHDWCQRSTNENFVDEIDIDNCVIERIISNKFWDPMISSDEEEPVQGPIDWDSVFKKNKPFEEKQYRYRVFVPGMRQSPPYPKLSALSKEEHRQCIKVLCAANRSVLPKEFLGRPIKADYAVFERTKETYAKEQKEYIEWAKNLWVTTNCIRALRPKPLIEMIYDAEFKMKAQRLQFFPKKYTSAAQIPLKADNHKCDIILPKADLVQANKSNVPEVFYPEIYEERISVLHACPMPEPCEQHPCKFKLPNESSESLLPLLEIHKELAQFALENGAQFIASENAIKCLLETDRIWTVPISVCEVIAADGERSNVVVLGSDFPVKKDSAPMRAHMAYKHLLLKAFTAKQRTRTYSDRSDGTMTSEPRTNRARNAKNSANNITDQKVNRQHGKESMRGRNVKADSHKAAQVYNDTLRKINRDLELSDSEDEERLQICVEDDDNAKPEVSQLAAVSDKPKEPLNMTEKTNEFDEEDDLPLRKILKAKRRMSQHQEEDNEMALYDCACKDTDFEISKPRSFKNWQIKNYTTKEQVDIIIHCSHKLQSAQKNDVILEPIVEYQLDIGGTLQSPQKIQSLMFSLMLRKNSELINVRVDGVSGEPVTIDTYKLAELTDIHGDFKEDIANSIYTALNQLAGLLPGEYLLRHEPVHGSNAVLYSSKWVSGLEALTLEWDPSSAPAEEPRLAQASPALGPVLLPIHKFRRHLPLTFTYDARHLAKEPVKPSARQKAPPAAIQWPKKKKKGKKPKKKTNETTVNY